MPPRPTADDCSRFQAHFATVKADGLAVSPVSQKRLRKGSAAYRAEESGVCRKQQTTAVSAPPPPAAKLHVAVHRLKACTVAASVSGLEDLAFQLQQVRRGECVEAAAASQPPACNQAVVDRAVEELQKKVQTFQRLDCPLDVVPVHTPFNLYLYRLATRGDRRDHELFDARLWAGCVVETTSKHAPRAGARGAGRGDAPEHAPGPDVRVVELVRDVLRVAWGAKGGVQGEAMRFPVPRPQPVDCVVGAWHQYGVGFAYVATSDARDAQHAIFHVSMVVTLASRHIVAHRSEGWRAVVG